ncbi:MAG TPA: hypothetical protein VFP93_03085, partial [Gammaproteobacteria bacterium]|nr:hypothetical protein [Gammaproteobacteria bacterium]
MSAPLFFHFNQYGTALRYTLAKLLFDQGWQLADCAEKANFSDHNLSLGDDISIVLEYKHLLALLAKHFFPNKMPQTFNIDDHNYHDVLKRVTKQKQQTPWILKPAFLNNGDYIYIFENLAQLRAHYSNPARLSGMHVLQKYIINPHLWEGSKYTFRLPVIATNYAGVFLYQHGYINISPLSYSLDFKPELKRKHITNYVIEGKISGIQQEATFSVPNFSRIFSQMVAIVQAVFQAVLAVFPRYLQINNTQIFEIFGFDFLLDANNKLWLLEINQGPDFPLDTDHPLYKNL